ncbi:hypothetical protein TL16_g11949 [Triparma laevis f. inornata]|uniref:Uncharacterized protein n=1 Tax=Triparma laevis f. inornata TaxID=1714386 RepID=A0A9W7BNB7_9STRA|nr:hypothetical protein TL16_g11949 [Triparma laevis f. inornata]
MRELLVLHPWRRALLHGISLNKVKVAPTVTTALSDMKGIDTVNLAKVISTIILSTTEAHAAVDHWIAQNVALEEFEREYAWMRPFFSEIVQYNLNTSNFGLRLRLTGGTLLSTVDLVTDIYMTVQFFNTDGQERYGRTNAWLIALDAYRVGSGAEQEDHQLMNQLLEMTYTKVIETVFEAIPASIVQIYALILAPKKSMGALISILVSAATVAFTSSMISYDWDTSPAKSDFSPLFYGYVPDKALPRAACFVSMMTLSFAHVLLLTFSCALLTVMGPEWLIYFLGLYMGL